MLVVFDKEVYDHDIDQKQLQESAENHVSNLHH